MSANEPLDDRYLTWLYRQVCSVKFRRSSASYWGLFRLLYTKEFIWFIPNDDNRAEDGKYLRHEFLERNRIGGVDPAWLDLECSMLELLIGLARRLSFEDDGKTSDWFWRLLENLNLEDYNDGAPIPADVISETLDRVIYRKYKRDGRGGLFPLHNPRRDQRKVELWYQLSAYLLETEWE